MGKHHPFKPFPDHPGATTLGPQVVRTITTDATYEDKTLAGVMDHGGNRLRVFRQSRAEHDHLSCDVYELEGGRWQPRCKEAVKYAPPEDFQGERVDIDGVPVWCHERLTPERVEAVRVILRRRPT